MKLYKAGYSWCIIEKDVKVNIMRFRTLRSIEFQGLLRRGLHEVSSEGKGARKERWEELNKGSLCELMQSIWRRI